MLFLFSFSLYLCISAVRTSGSSNGKDNQTTMAILTCRSWSSLALGSAVTPTLWIYDDGE